MPGSHPGESHLIGFGCRLDVGIYKSNSVLLGMAVYDWNSCDLGGNVICLCVFKVVSRAMIIEGWIRIGFLLMPRHHPCPKKKAVFW